MLNDTDIYSKIKKYTPDGVTLTKCQFNALYEIVHWWFNTNETDHVLMGSAGTGKSFTTNVVKEILADQGSISISAPTHKAKRVVSDFTGLEGITIHALLGLKLNTKLDDFDIDNLLFTREKEEKGRIVMYDLCIIDEASMINEDLREFLVTSAKDANCRILFVGDHLQLPPVGADDSPVFNTERFSVLSTPARQEYSNPLYLTLCALRYDIEPSLDNLDAFKIVASSFDIDVEQFQLRDNRVTVFEQLIEWKSKWLTEDHQGYAVLPKSVFLDQMKKHFESSEFTKNKDFVRYLSFTNKDVASVNEYIRSAVVEDDTELLQVGDVLMSYVTVLNSDNNQTLQNSDEYVVTEEKSTISVKTILVNNIAKTVDIPVKVLTLRNLTTNLHSTITVTDYQEGNNLRTQYKNFIDAHAYYYKNAKYKKAWAAYYDFRDSHLTMDDLKRKLRDNSYPTKCLDYAFGLTIHKSQGSSIHTTFVNMKEIMRYPGLKEYFYKKNNNGKEMPEEERIKIKIYTLKLLYVALSRASHNCFILED